MWTAKWILDAYEAGSDAVRWELYLTYRDLRSCFDEMETRPEGKDIRKEVPTAEKPVGAWWHSWARLVKG